MRADALTPALSHREREIRIQLTAGAVGPLSHREREIRTQLIAGAVGPLSLEGEG
ncbi:hypothetical protein FBBNIHIM_06285 [Pseudocitrobacter vendiensis]|uniref:Uncharacterized protein n=1 Tax=Pseudocitrobacter vendiensis TaxID=2488306 RepID=A0ABM9F6K8_9ENTR|nr:hypothetical protein FBBNIHIM_06285 [Pseudocitrobacter vendiensis]